LSLLAIVPTQRTSSNRSRWRPFDETDVDSIRKKVFDRIILFIKKCCFFCIQESRNANDNPKSKDILLIKKKKNLIYFSSIETRSISMPRYIDSEEFDPNFVNNFFFLNFPIENSFLQGS